MSKFKFTVSKNQKRYELVLQVNSEAEARERIHKEGYSILSVEEITNLDIAGNKFLFTINLNGELKTGAIYGEDVFKAYLKLRKDFSYDVVSLFSESDKEKSEDYKKDLLKRVTEEYNLFISNIKQTKKEKNDEKKNEININHEDFYLKKQLVEIYKLIDFVLIKINNIIGNKYFDVEEEHKEKLKTIYNSLISIKNSRNINKLKEIGELALIKIGNLELQYLEKTKSLESKDLLKQTNKLLKQIGSKEQFIEKDKDLVYKIKNFINNIFILFINSKEKNDVAKKDILDKESHSYVKTLVLLKKYREKQEINKKEIINNIKVFIFPFGKNEEKKDYLLSRKLVIAQNISLLKAKLEGRIFSYTKIIKGYIRIEEIFLVLIKFINNYLFLALFIWSFIFFLYILFNYFGLLKYDISIEGIKYSILLFIIYMLSFYTKGFITFIFNFVFFCFLYIFLIVNF